MQRDKVIRKFIERNIQIKTKTERQKQRVKEIERQRPYNSERQKIRQWWRGFTDRAYRQRLQQRNRDREYEARATDLITEKGR